MERHTVTTTPPDPPVVTRARLECRTCGATEYTDLTGDELHQFAFTDTSWHRTSQ